MSEKTPEALLNDIEQYLEKAATLLGRSEYVSLAGLEGMVENLCKRVMELKPEQAVTFADDLTALRDRLDVLQQAMEAKKGEIADEINKSDTRQKASKAYRKPEEKK